MEAVNIILRHIRGEALVDHVAIQLQAVCMTFIDQSVQRVGERLVDRHRIRPYVDHVDKHVTAAGFGAVLKRRFAVRLPIRNAEVLIIAVGVAPQEPKVPGVPKHGLHRRGQQREFVAERLALGQTRGHGHQIRTERSSVAARKDLDRLLFIGMAPVLVGLGLPAQPSLLVAQPDDRAEAESQIAANRAAVPRGNRNLRISGKDPVAIAKRGVARPQRNLQHQILHGQVAPRFYLTVEDHIAVVFDVRVYPKCCTVTHADLFKGRSGLGGLFQSDAAVLPGDGFAAYTACQGYRGGQDLCPTCLNMPGERRRAEDMPPAPDAHFHRAVRLLFRFQRRPRRQYFVGMSLLCVDPFRFL